MAAATMFATAQSQTLALTDPTSEVAQAVARVNELAEESQNIAQKYQDARELIDDQIRTRIMEDDVRSIEKGLAELGK